MDVILASASNDPAPVAASAGLYMTMGAYIELPGKRI